MNYFLVILIVYSKSSLLIINPLWCHECLVSRPLASGWIHFSYICCLLGTCWGRITSASARSKYRGEVWCEDKHTLRDFWIFFFSFYFLLQFLYLSVYFFLPLSPSCAVCFSLSLFYFFFYVSRRLPDRKFLIFSIFNENQGSNPTPFSKWFFFRFSDCVFEILSCDHKLIVLPWRPCLTPSCLSLAALLLYGLPAKDMLRSHHFCFSAEQI